MQEALVILIVAVALAYTVWRFVPARWLQRWVRQLGLNDRLAQAGSCHSCDDCAGCGDQTPSRKS